MKRLLILAIISIFGVSSLLADEAQLNKELEVRIKANNILTKELTKYAGDSKFKAELIPLETKSGVAWTEYLNFVIKSKDVKLKAYALRTEYVQEIINAYYDMEYEKDAETVALLEKKIKDLKVKLEGLETTYLKIVGEKPAVDEKSK
ncbi:MAG: hypothetical protein ACSHX6_00530 [Akkermansiaceae bacterium]